MGIVFIWKTAFYILTLSEVHSLWELKNQVCLKIRENFMSVAWQPSISPIVHHQKNTLKNKKLILNTNIKKKLNLKCNFLRDTNALITHSTVLLYLLNMQMNDILATDNNEGIDNSHVVLTAHITTYLYRTALWFKSSTQYRHSNRALPTLGKKGVGWNYLTIAMKF